MMKQLRIAWLCCLVLIGVSLVSTPATQAESAECREQICSVGAAAVAEVDNQVVITRQRGDTPYGVSIDRRDGNRVRLAGLPAADAVASGAKIELTLAHEQTVLSRFQLQSVDGFWQLQAAADARFTNNAVVSVFQQGAGRAFVKDAPLESVQFGQAAWVEQAIVNDRTSYYEQWTFQVAVDGDSAEMKLNGSTMRAETIVIQTPRVTTEAAAQFLAPTHLQVTASAEIESLNFTQLSVSNRNPATNAPDLGDAPDSSNHFETKMPAYAGVWADFPTVYDDATGLPVGPYHHNDITMITLGQDISWEEEADKGFDSDWGINNIDPLTGRADQDRFDDGFELPQEIERCQPIRVKFMVDVLPAATVSDAYINFWFDWDRNGRWGGASECPNGESAEWAIQNQPISWSGAGYYIFETKAILPPQSLESGDLWVRATLSHNPAPAEDGRGLTEGYKIGETEDLLWEFSVSADEQYGDLGDAPTSFNNWHEKMSAYAGMPLGTARYPVVYDWTVTGQPPGPYIHFPREQAWLGKAVSLEREADLYPSDDEELETNIEPPLDVNDRDADDDGIVWETLSLPKCDRTKFDYTVSSAVTATVQDFYVNAWFDFNRDGDWDDKFECEAENGQVHVVYEWSVQDQAIVVPAGAVMADYTTPAFGATADGDVWMRLLLTEQPIQELVSGQPIDGRGPKGGIKYGEVEDHLIKIPSDPKHCDLAIDKKHEPDPILFGQTATYHVGIVNVGTSDCEAPIVMQDWLPMGMLVVGTINAPNWLCTTMLQSSGQQVVTCSYTGSAMAAGSAETISMTVSVPSTTPVHSSWDEHVAINCAAVQVDNDVESSNNKICHEAEVIKPEPVCDLEIKKWSTPDTLTFGLAATYHIAVTNVGTGPCKGPITVEDHLPTNMVVTSFLTGGVWSCSVSGSPQQIVECIFPGTLPASSSLVAIGVEVMVPASADAVGVGWHNHVAENCVRLNVAEDIDTNNNSTCIQSPCAECEEGQQVFNGGTGLQDNFSSVGNEVTQPSAALADYIGSYPTTDYDATHYDQFFIESFAIPDDESRPICAARLTIRLKKFNHSQQSNDTISLNFIEYDGSGVATAAYPGAGWSRYVNDLMDPNSVVTLHLDLAALPLANGSVQNIVPILSQLRHLDLIVQDDTAVDFVNLHVQYCCDEVGELPDHGDAPERGMTAYRTLGVYANFPTRYNEPAAPRGPRHLHPESGPVLGNQVSGEQDADQFPDWDTVTNIDVNADVPNRDRYDDALLEMPDFPECGHTSLDYIVVNLGATTSMHFNLWVDFNQDGDWEDIAKCKLESGATLAVPEWAVQNQSVHSIAATGNMMTTPMFPALDIEKDGMWMRLMLSDGLADPAGDGRGPLGGYKRGETEDYYLRPNGTTFGGGVWIDREQSGSGRADQVPAEGINIRLSDTVGHSAVVITDENGRWQWAEPRDWNAGSQWVGPVSIQPELESGWVQTSAPIEPVALNGKSIEIADITVAQSWDALCRLPKHLAFDPTDPTLTLPLQLYNRTAVTQTYTSEICFGNGSCIEGAVIEAAGYSDILTALPVTVTPDYQGLVTIDILDVRGTRFQCSTTIAPKADVGYEVTASAEPIQASQGKPRNVRFPVTNTSSVSRTLAYQISADLTRMGEQRSNTTNLTLNGLPEDAIITGTLAVGPNTMAHIPVAVTWSGSDQFFADIVAEIDANGDGMFESVAATTLEAGNPTAIVLQEGQASPSRTLTLVLSLFAVVGLLTLAAHRRSE